MGFVAAAANGLWVAGALPAAGRFRAALGNPERAQGAILRRILRENRATEFGRRYGFEGLTDARGYQRAVPLCDFDDAAPAVERTAAGEQGVLTTERVRLLEPSGGTSAGSGLGAKLIPYTRSLQVEFQRGIGPWIVDLFAHDPQAAMGPAYWSLSPLVERERYTAGGIPIGFEEESAYLGALGKVVEAAMAAPNALKRVADVTAFRYVTLLFLLATPELRLVSVWNPTFWSLLLKPLGVWWDWLLDDLGGGTITLPPEAVAPEEGTLRDLTARLRERVRGGSKRRETLGRMTPDGSPEFWRALWPKLRVISCWADGPAAPYAAALAEQFPHVRVQGKGLIATEAMVSLPMWGAPAPVLAVTSHFLEFVKEGGECLPAHEVREGERYGVVVTTGGGLYRYRLHDMVEVVGRARATPCVRFVGKADRVSDLFGEKLDEGFVASAVQMACAECGVEARFALLAPRTGTGEAPRYVLYVEADRRSDQLWGELERRLKVNFHYDYCRRLGQLGPVQVEWVWNGGERYLEGCAARGQRLGDVKPVVLDKREGWDAWLLGDGEG